jgi:hypothetical protein
MSREKLTPEVVEYFRSLGLRYGSEAGKAAARNMTKAQRVARAKKAVAAREAKRKVRNAQTPI